MNLAQIVQSHALSFFHLSSPDLLLGFDADPADAQHLRRRPRPTRSWPATASRLRQFGQQIIEWLGGKRIHPAWVVPGGVDAPLTAETRDRILAAIPEALAAIAAGARAGTRRRSTAGPTRPRRSATSRRLFMGLVDDDGDVEHYDGRLRVVDADGHDRRRPASTRGAISDYLGEAVEPWSYLKSTYCKPLGYPDGVYRVGPLARLNVADRMGTPRADAELDEFRRGSAACPCQLVPLPLRPADRDPLRRRADRRAARRPGHPRRRASASIAGINRQRGRSASPRRRAARCSTTTGSTTTGSSSGPTC